MRIGLMSDVHSNLPALEAVLTELERERVERLLCLGDLVGYNAQPSECLDLLQRRSVECTRGNHDEDVARRSPSESTNKPAALAQAWTAASIRARDAEYLLSLTNRILEPGQFIAVHGCFLNDHHVSGYVTSTMVEHNLSRIAERADWPKLAFCGHTHVPMMAWLSYGEVTEARAQGLVRWPEATNAVLINPGAVGQPRDGDVRASYAVVDTVNHAADFRRVEYDIERAARAIEEAGLPASLADRLRNGR
jgi:diadenosine tetraphosphatase ApaH/serine/threonine PP2A family protein phosphatase